MQTTQGSLVIIDASKVFWNGKIVQTTSVMVHADEDSQTVKLRVAGDDPAYAEMEAAGIKIVGVKK